MDRFPQPLQVHLEPSDISEVTSKRVLAKNAEAQTELRELFSQHRGRLTDATRLTADIRLPELSTESFVDLYPLLPYQVDLIINVVSGLRTAGGASKHVGGANRTIIKLAQQLLIHPDVDLAHQQVGMLARIDQVYELVSGNIPSEIRGKIDGIKTAGRAPPRAAGRPGDLPAPVRPEHPPHAREHRSHAAGERRRRFAPRRSQGRARGARARAHACAQGRRRVPHPVSGGGRLGAAASRHRSEAGRCRAGPRRDGRGSLAAAAFAHLPRRQAVQGGSLPERPRRS